MGIGSDVVLGSDFESTKKELQRLLPGQNLSDADYNWWANNGGAEAVRKEFTPVEANGPTQGEYNRALQSQADTLAQFNAREANAANTQRSGSTNASDLWSQYGSDPAALQNAMQQGGVTAGDLANAVGVDGKLMVSYLQQRLSPGYSRYKSLDELSTPTPQMGASFGASPAPTVDPYTQRINSFLSANPGASDSQIRHWMNVNQIDSWQMSKATGIPLEDVFKRYDSAAPTHSAPDPSGAYGAGFYQGQAVAPTGAPSPVAPPTTSPVNPSPTGLIPTYQSRQPTTYQPATPAPVRLIQASQSRVSNPAMNANAVTAVSGLPVNQSRFEFAAQPSTTGLLSTAATDDYLQRMRDRAIADPRYVSSIDRSR